MEVVIKYKDISYNIKNFGYIILERVGNPKNPANPYYVMDQLNIMNIFIKLSDFSDYVFKTYGLTEEQYYNLVVFGDPELKHYCPNCGKLLEFKGFRFQGRGGYEKWCSASCQAKCQAKEGTHPFQISRELNSKISSEHARKLNGELLAQNRHPLKDPLVIAKRLKVQYVNRAKKKNWTTAVLYKATLRKVDNIIKIGITQDIKSRSLKQRSYGGFDLSYDIISEIVRGDLEFIAELEYEIKQKFSDHIKIGNEYYDENILDDILKFIEEFTKQYKN